MRHKHAEILTSMGTEAMKTVEDGFDLAYVEGIGVVARELNEWDGGISENYLKGIEDALNKLKELNGTVFRKD